jgi:hypothetical protein
MRCTEEISMNLYEKLKSQAKLVDYYALAMVKIHTVEMIFISGLDGAFCVNEDFSLCSF